MNKAIIPIALMAVSSIIIFTHDQNSTDKQSSQKPVAAVQQESAPPSTLPLISKESEQMQVAQNTQSPSKQAPAMLAAPVSPNITAPPQQPSHQSRNRHGHNTELAHGHEVHTKPVTHNGKIPPTGAHH